MKNATKKDVAEAAGVSHMTVTRVLSNHPYVSDAVREKVLKSCKKLRYRQNKIALSLRNNKGYAIGVMVPTFGISFFARFLAGVEEKCVENGYHIISAQTHAARRKRKTLDWEYAEFLLERKIDGMVIIGTPSSVKQIGKNLKTEKIPAVFADIPSNDSSFSFVGTAEFEGTKEITRYVIHLGHKNIIFLGGGQRLEGFKAALEEAEIDLEQDAGVCHLKSPTDYTAEAGYAATEKLLDSGRRFTAIISANDYLAIGALSALNRRGIKVPDEVSVTGFAGDEIGAYTSPPLTTMLQPIEEIGRKSVEILLDKISNPSRKAERVLLKPKFLERGSVKRC